MSWVESEFKAINLGDERLNRRCISIIESLGLAPGRSIPQTFQSWSEIKAAYKFFSNSLVSDEKLIRAHKDKTIERIEDYPIVLFPSDTTEIDYTSKKKMTGKERLSNKKNGLWLHSTIAITPERLNLGVVEANFWSRNPEVSTDNGSIRDRTPIEEKESYRWLKSYRLACEVSRKASETQIINIMDREGDLTEIFSEHERQIKKGKCADFIIRSKHDRVIDDKESEQGKNKIRNKLEESPTLGEVEFSLSSRENRLGRKVKQELKSVRVLLTQKRKNKQDVEVNAVMAIEKKPPKGEKPLTWIFITSLPINSFDEIANIIKYYMCRWEIETFFKVLKSGCKIEERQLQGTNRMKSLITVFLVLSWRVMFTMMMGRINSEMSAGDIFEPSEWKSVHKILNKNTRLPRKPPPLGEFIEMIAILGGYTKTNENSPPGVKVMWKGMVRMVDFSIAWEAFGG